MHDNRGRQSEAGGPIRVLWVIKTMDPGGAERLLITFASCHDRTAFEFETAFVQRQQDLLVPELEVAGVRVHDLGVDSGFDVRWLWRIRRLVMNGRFDVVHVHSPLLAGMIRPVMLSIPAGRRPRLVVTEHNSWNVYRLPVRMINHLTYRVDDVRLAVSSEARSSLPAAMRERTQVVVAGVPRDKLTAFRLERDAVRAEFGLSEQDCLAVSVANFRPEKDHPALLAAAREVLNHRSDVYFLVIGVGPLEERMRQLQGELGLGEHFRILGYRKDAVRIVAGADMFVLSSAFEGFPVAVMEALAVGVPVVATAVGGVPDAVRDRVEGRVVPPHRPELLARAILDLAGDRAALKTMAAAALARGNEFDIATAVQKMEAVYRSMVFGSDAHDPRKDSPECAG